MIHSYSDLLTFGRCPKKYEFSAMRNLQRRAKPVNLELGTYFHELLMGHYQGRFEDKRAELQEHVDTAPLIDDEIFEAQDLLNQAEFMVGAYLDYYKDEGDVWEVLHCEETFTVTLDSGDMVSFTPDLVIRDSRGVWIVDHKTTAAMPKAKSVGDFQAFLYSSAMREIYPDFRGFIFNYVRKKRPTVPRLTKTKPIRIYDIGRIDTTYEILRDFVVNNVPELMDDPATRRRLAELKDENRFFWREYVFVTDEMADASITDTISRIRMVDLCIGMGEFPRTFLPYAGAQECDNCAFKTLCVAEMRGYDTEFIMSEYEERDMSHRNYEHEEVTLHGTN